MYLPLIVFAVVLVMLGCGLYQYQLYYQTPHDEGDPVLFVERGCKVGSSLWVGFHYDTLVVTESELLLNDVLTWFGSKYINTRPCTHTVRRAAIKRVEVGDFKYSVFAPPANLHVVYTNGRGEEMSYFIESKDPRTVMHFLEISPPTTTHSI